MSKVKALVPISGGKDSHAALKLALEHHPADEVRGLFCDTQFEHPLTYAHVEALRTMYGNVRIDTVTDGSVLDKSTKYGRFPGGGSRHCTDELKIRLTKIYCTKLALEQGSVMRNAKKKIGWSDEGGFTVWYGMRLAESDEREKRYAGKVGTEIYRPHEVMHSKYPQYLGDLGVRFRLAVLEWSDQDVIDYVGWENLNPLYRAGFPRVGCFPCLASGDKWKEKAFQFDDFGREQYKRVIVIAKEIGKDVFTSKGGKLRNPMPDNDNSDSGNGCALCSM